MSLYGLDILIDGNDNPHLIEFNGVRSGMGGFREIYGDSRVEEQVWQMIGEENGEITVNDGSYEIKQFKKKHPVKYLFSRLYTSIGPIRRRRNNPYGIFSSPDAETEWIEDLADLVKTKPIHFPFEIYTGQDSVVLNAANQQLPHPLVNPYIAESITTNKFLQYLLLMNSEIGEFMPKSAVVGLGFTDEKALEELLDGSSSFVKKPILSSCGVGVKFLSNEEAEKYKNSRGPANPINYPQTVLDLVRFRKRRIVYVEDFVAGNYFCFEPALAIIQPFIDSRIEIGGQEVYTSIRAIVCNGSFVDAYMGASHEPRVNFTQGAQAYPFRDAGFGEFCERIVAVFEEECTKYSTDTFQKDLYTSYVDARGRTSNEEREFDYMKPFYQTIFGGSSWSTSFKLNGEGLNIMTYTLPMGEGLSENGNISRNI